MTMNTTMQGRTARNDEVCPLCLSRYPAAIEQVCVACEAPSCPECVERLSDEAALCFACHGSTRH